MNKLSPVKFKKVYLIGTFGSLIMFLITFLAGVIILSEDVNFKNSFMIGIILIVLGVLFLLVTILFIVKGRKRFINLENELIELELQKPLSEINPLNFPYLKKAYNKQEEGDNICINEEGLKLGDNEVIPWDYFKSAEYYDQYISLGNTRYGKEGFDGVFLLAHPLIVSLLKRFLKVEISEERLEAQQRDYEEIVKSTVVWKYNWILLIEKILFVFVVILIGTSVGLYLIVKDITDMSIGILIANILTIPTLLLWYPRRFADSISRCLMVNLEGIGYSMGRRSIFIDWFSIMKVEVTPRDVRIHYALEFDDELKGFDFIVIKRDEKLVNLIKQYQDDYEFLFSLIIYE